MRRCAAVAACAVLCVAGRGDGIPSLKNLMPRTVLIGVAVSAGQVMGRDAAAAALIDQQFDSLTPENLLKPALVHPEPDRYAWDAADGYVAFGAAHHMTLIGHTLVWHNQTPAWMFAGKDGSAADRETLLARMREHIHAVVGRYKGRIKGWDVVNEAIADDDSGRLRETRWLAGIGPDYVAKAFSFAHEADPDAELYYNDYNLARPAKRRAAIALAKDLRAQGLRIDAIGEQGHWMLDRPSTADIDATIADIAAAGFKAQITELDVDVLPREAKLDGADVGRRAERRPEADPYVSGLPDATQQELARRYADVFALFLKHRDDLRRVTFWGLDDRQTWLNNYPVRGRTNHPLLFDREGRPKPAFDAVVRVLQGR